jgi:hypothetical protein
MYSYLQVQLNHKLQFVLICAALEEEIPSLRFYFSYIIQPYFNLLLTDIFIIFK